MIRRIIKRTQINTHLRFVGRFLSFHYQDIGLILLLAALRSDIQTGFSVCTLYEGVP